MIFQKNSFDPFKFCKISYTGFDIKRLSDCPGQVKCVFGQVKTAPILSDRASENDSVIWASRRMYHVFYAILFYFVDYRIPLSQIKIVLFILANRECLIRRWRCIDIVFIFTSQWKARVICAVLILENYSRCVLPLRSKHCCPHHKV